MNPEIYVMSQEEECDNYLLCVIIIMQLAGDYVFFVNSLRIAMVSTCHVL